MVIPPWNFPVAIPTGGVTAALAAGSAVIIKPAPQTVACAEVMVQAVHRGLERHGIDTDLVQFLRADEADAGQRLISHEDVDHVILTGASETGQDRPRRGGGVSHLENRLIRPLSYLPGVHPCPS